MSGMFFIRLSASKFRQYASKKNFKKIRPCASKIFFGNLDPMRLI